MITMVAGSPEVRNPDFPPIGSTVDAVLLGYTEIGDEPRLSVRPLDVAAAKGGDRQDQHPDRAGGVDRPPS